MAAPRTSKKKAAADQAASSLRHPRDTLNLHGQQEADALFLQAYASGRLPHAWLITGPKGIGKASFAYRAVRFLMGGADQQAKSMDANFESPAVRRVQSGSHTDLLVLEAPEGGDISVDEARQVNQFLSLTPAEGKWRIVIIDSIDAMNRNAANALLKTLEEPPAGALLLLISHNPGALLPTIRSRCRLLKLKPLFNKDFNSILHEHAPELDGMSLSAYHQFSGGAPGVALFLLEHEALALYHAFLSLFLGGSNAPDWHKAHALAEQLASKQDAARFEAAGLMLQYWFRQIIRASGGQGVDLEVLEGESALLFHLAAFRDTESWLALWERVAILMQDVRRIHLDRKQALINIIGAMARGGNANF